LQKNGVIEVYSNNNYLMRGTETGLWGFFSGMQANPPENSNFDSSLHDYLIVNHHQTIKR
jgi:hypothetical protein